MSGSGQAGGVQNGISALQTTIGYSDPMIVDAGIRDVVSVKDYGAKGDGVQRTAAITIAAGNPRLLTVAGASFATGDAGKRIFVAGIGAAGVPLNTTIAGVVGPTQVLLTDAASTFLAASSKRVTYGTDDTAALNEAADALRAELTTQNGRNASLDIPAGIYIVTSTINMTGTDGCFLRGHGAALYGATNGRAIVDAMATYGIHVEGLTLLGDEGAPPNVGWQLGRNHSGQQAFGRNVYNELIAYGYFTLAPLYCMASETSLFTMCNLNNSTTNAYACIVDGINHFGLTSDFVTVSLAADTSFTNTVATFIQCKFVAQGAGCSALWTANANGHRYESCYWNAPVAGVVIYAGSLIRNNDVRFTGTIEGPSQYNFLFDGPSSSTLAGFTFDTCANVATVATFGITADLPAMKIYGMRATLASVSTGRLIFESPAKWSVTGDLTFLTLTDGWVSPTYFRGTISVADSLSADYNTAISLGPDVAANRQRITATATHTIAATTGWASLVQAGTVAAVTLNLPTPAYDGQILRISTRGAITALTLTPASGTIGWTADATLAANSGIAFGWDATSAHWTRIV